MPNSLPLLRAAIMRDPWAIVEDRLEAIAEVVERRAAGIYLSPEEIAAFKGPRGSSAVIELMAVDASGEITHISEDAGGDNPASGTSRVAVINVRGIIAQHASQVDNISGPGGTSTERLSTFFRQAMADPSISAIVFNVDSPGGSVHGVQMLADEIFAARGKKPIVAQVNSQMASAAYWIGSAADEIVMTPGAVAGSIGVYAVHQNLSAKAEKDGVKPTIISAGKYKTEGHPFTNLTEEAAGHMQKQVNSYYSDFVNAVARHRGVSATDVMDGFGQGRMEKDKAAVKAGLADKIGTLDDTIRAAAARSNRKPKMRADLPVLPVEGASSFSVTVIDGKTYLPTDVPQKAIVSKTLLEESHEPVMSFDGEMLKFTVANGTALYRVVGVAAGYIGALIFDLVSANLTAAPEQPKVASPVDTDAFRRRRHAARSRG